MGQFTKNGRRARQPRYEIDGLPFEIFATDDPDLAYLVTEPATDPVGYLFRRVPGNNGMRWEALCEGVEEDVTRGDLARMELCDEGKAPTFNTLVGVVIQAFLTGLVNASYLSGRPVDEGFAHDEPKKRRGTERKRAKSAKSIQF